MLMLMEKMIIIVRIIWDKIALLLVSVLFLLFRSNASITFVMSYFGMICVIQTEGKNYEEVEEHANKIEFCLSPLSESHIHIHIHIPHLFNQNVNKFAIHTVLK